LKKYLINIINSIKQEKINISYLDLSNFKTDEFILIILNLIHIYMRFTIPIKKYSLITTENYTVIQPNCFDSCEINNNQLLVRYNNNNNNNYSAGITFDIPILLKNNNIYSSLNYNLKFKTKSLNNLSFNIKIYNGIKWNNIDTLISNELCEINFTSKFNFTSPSNFRISVNNATNNEFLIQDIELNVVNDKELVEFENKYKNSSNYRKIYIDCGVYKGEEIKIAEKYFDYIYGFEPFYTELKDNYNFKYEDKITIYENGLSNKNGECKIYKTDTLIGSSLYLDKFNVSNDFKNIKIMKLSDFIKQNLNKEDIIFIKINIEGSEIDVLEDLYNNNMFDYIHSIHVDYDYTKIKNDDNYTERAKKIVDIVNKQYSNIIVNDYFYKCNKVERDSFIEKWFMTEGETILNFCKE
jgi:FkbM family methyltransferase